MSPGLILRELSPMTDRAGRLKRFLTSSAPFFESEPALLDPRVRADLG